jgi:hypothetical protein
MAAPPAPLPAIAPAEPIPTWDAPPGLVGTSGDDHDEPPLPDEARARAAGAAAAPTAPLDAGAGRVLHVRFGGAPDRLVTAMEAFKALLRERPGATPVILHVPGSDGGGLLPMPLRRGVAYDAELVAAVRRQLGDGNVELHLD